MNAEFKPPWYEISYDRLKTISNISEGQSCKVQKAELKADDGTTIKVATKAYTNFKIKEIEILAQLQHKNVIKFIGAVTKDGKNILIMEYTPHGNLFDYLRKQNKRLSVNHSLEWAKHCSNAVAYLHSKDIIHHDIKSHNFLLGLLSDDFTEIKGVSAHVLKLCDFGISHKTSSSATSTQTKVGGLSMGYAAPEVIRNCKNCSSCSDVYSLAVVIWELFTGERPYEGLDDYELMTHICEGKTPKTESIQCPGVTQILQKCWTKEKGDRPSARRVVELLNEITDDDVEPDSQPDYSQSPAPFKEVAEGLTSLAATFSSIGLKTHESLQPSIVQQFTPRESQPRSPQRTVTDSELQELTHHLGKHWREFGSILGYRLPELDVFDINNKINVKDAMYDMLYSWRSKYGNEATVGNLVNHLDNFEHINPNDYQFLTDDSKKD